MATEYDCKMPTAEQLLLSGPDALENHLAPALRCILSKELHMVLMDRQLHLALSALIEGTVAAPPTQQALHSTVQGVLQQKDIQKQLSLAIEGVVNTPQVQQSIQNTLLGVLKNHEIKRELDQLVKSALTDNKREISQLVEHVVEHALQDKEIKQGIADNVGNVLQHEGVQQGLSENVENVMEQESVRRVTNSAQWLGRGLFVLAVSAAIFLLSRAFVKTFQTQNPN